LTQLVRAMVKRAAENRHEHMLLINDLKFLPPLQQQEIKLAQARALDSVVKILGEINPDLMRGRRERSGPAPASGVSEWGESVHAVVVLKDGQAASAGDIVDH